MGGHAFDKHDPPLSTPRMSQEIYVHVRNYVLNTLLKHFTDAKTPIEVPDKVDHGDVDVLVHGALQPELDLQQTPKQDVAQKLAGILSAREYIVGKREQPIQLALRWPELFNVKDDPVERFIQVDLHICKDYNTFRWEYFHAAHGDLWSILGSTTKPFGLTVNDKGLFLRILEIEAFDKKKSLVYLTDDPTEILKFLGMDPTRWFKKFPSKSEMYFYAAR
jgi:hypothetical protein